MFLADTLVAADSFSIQKGGSREQNISGDKHRKFAEVWMCSFWDKRADRRAY